jgi:hypothetical protein
MTEKVFLAIELSHGDLNKIAQRASEIDLPLDQILSHIAQHTKPETNNEVRHAKPTLKRQSADARMLAH